MNRCVGRISAAILAAACAAFTGCNAAPKPGPGLPESPPIDLSAYDAGRVVQAMNERAERLARFWAATIATIWYVGQQGEDQVEQLDGDLHVVQPDRIAWILQKVGVDGAALGANERFYWYVDLTADDPVASIGTHARFEPGRLRELGVPVHPLDLMLLLGICPVPAEAAGSLERSRDGGHLVVTAPARWGTVRTTIDPQTFEPVRVELYRPGQTAAAVTADMQGRVPFDDRLHPQAPAVFIPERVLIDVPEVQARVRIRFLGAQASRRKPDERAFDLGLTLSRYGVRFKRDLDVAQPRGGAGQP